MKPTMEYLSNELKRKEIRLSHQRLKVLEYLIQYPCHPTADQIYVNLKQDVATLSKTTVYNTLNSLVDAGIIRRINIEGNETRYDIITDNHGHFKCESCGEIYNFEIDLFRAKGLEQFEINDKNVYFKGICPRCH